MTKTNRYRAAREAARPHLSQCDVAFALWQATGSKLNQVRVSEWERGIKPVPKRFLKPLCAILNIPEHDAAPSRPAIQPGPCVQYVFVPLAKSHSTYADVR